MQPLEAVGPQMLNAVVMKMPVWERKARQNGRPQHRAGGGGGGLESRRWLKQQSGGRSMDGVTPVVQPFNSRDKTIGQDRLLKLMISKAGSMMGYKVLTAY